MAQVTKRPRTPSGRGATPPPSRRPGSKQPSGHRPPSRRRPRTPWYRGPLAIGVVAVVVVAVVIGFAVLGRSTATAPAASGAGGTTPVPADVLKAVTAPDAKVLATVGAGGIEQPLKRVSGATALTGPTGKPEVLYVGGEFCPFCAAERWSLVIALSRFGTFQNLGIISSSEEGIATFTFYGASYSSQYIDFVSRETAGQDSATPLETLSPSEKGIVSGLDGPPYAPTTAGIPFTDYGNQWLAISSGYSPNLIKGMSWQQIAAALSDPSSPVAQAVLGNANRLTAGICLLTNNQPASVCAAPPIAALEAQVPH